MSLLLLERTPHTAVSAVTPPTPVLTVRPAVGFGDTSTPKSSPTFDVVNGDLLTLIAFSEDSTVTLGTPTWDGTGTWTLQQSVVVSSYCTAYAFTCPVTATAAGRTITVAQTGGLTRMWSFVAFLWRNHGGVGVTGKANVTGGKPSLTLPVSAGSALVCGVSDWAAVDGTSRTWQNVNGAAMTEALYFRSAANYTVYGSYAIDSAGLAGGPETVGLTAPAGQTYAIVGLEVKGTVSTTNTGTLAVTAPRAAASITGTQTNPGTLAATPPLPVVAIAEAATVAGTLTVTAPRAVAAISGTLTNPATLTVAAPRAVPAIAGTLTNPGTLTVTAPRAVVAISATEGNAGTLAVTAPSPVVAIAGTQADPGTLQVTTPKPTVALAGTMTNHGTWSTTVPRPVAAIAGTMGNGGTLVTVVPVPVVAIAGVSTNPGTFDVSTPRVMVDLAGELTNLGTVDVVAPVLTLAIAGECINAGSLDVAGLLPVMVWFGASTPQVDITVTGHLDLRRWEARLPGRVKVGALDPRRRWVGRLPDRDKSGTLNTRRWKGSTS